MRLPTKTGNYISTRIGRAIADYSLIEDKDRILVAVSGGKDSMSLLKLLNERRRWAPIDYELIAVHVESDYECARCVDTKRLKKFFARNKIEYHFEKVRLLDGERKDVSCFWCSWNRRKALFTLADRLGCTKVALGHHKDDIIETLLLNMFYHGEFSAMNPRQELFGGKIVIIRPLCYVEESALKKFARESKFPAQLSTCPHSDKSKRSMMKRFISAVEKDCDYVKMNIFNSIARVNREYIQIGAVEKNSDEKLDRCVLTV
ncbi:MAG: ATP-binding protein [Candidatus Omnitrophica bacterium]|nr:ATP-binding protein [Candidatus Omnitrophota bacterium]